MYLKKMNRILFPLNAKVFLVMLLAGITVESTYSLGFNSYMDDENTIYEIERRISNQTTYDFLETLQNIVVKGKVTDTNGEPLPGATISVAGTPRGVITDIDGTYTIEVRPDDKLIFSFIGMENQTIEVGNKTLIDVTLRDKTELLDEVQIVAFGKQKKESVVGSIETINPSELKVPSSNLTTALAGRLSGLISYQRSGEPGHDNAEFFVRGVTTFGYKKSPLILIDGIELTTTDLARLQPDDIESFSIMKDATATALYGARGANGVILVTTKEGEEGKIKINVRYEKSSSMPTQMIDIADPITYMQLHNEAVLTRDPLGGRVYSMDKIKMTQQPHRNEMVYPAVNWTEEMFTNYSLNDRFNFSANGGGKVARYYLAATYNSDNGILKVDKRNNFNNNVKFNRISLRSNININATESTEIIVRFNSNFDDYKGPIDGGETLFRKALQTNPVLYAPYYEPDLNNQNTKHILFGNAGRDANYLNPYADMVKGYKDESRSAIMATVELKQNLDFITKGLSARIMGNTTRHSFYNVSRAYKPYYYSLGSYDPQLNRYTLTELNPDDGTQYLEYAEGNKEISTSTYFEGAINYNQSFDEKHTISGLLVGIMRESIYANAGNLQQSLPYRNLGLSGRFTYAYDNKYFTELNFGYNGSERFAANERFGFFPSIGLGWVMSNENFWNPNNSLVHKLKLKATYGLVGNDAIGSAEDRFFYISQVNMNDGNKGVSFGQNFTEHLNGISINRYSNDQISWETARMTDFGIELGLFNFIELQADYFHEYRTNILMDRSQVPSSMGLQAPLRANIGEASSQGIDMSLDIQHFFNHDFWITSRANFTYATGKYEVYEELDWVSAGLPWRSWVGLPIGQPTGYIAERLFVDEADIAVSPSQSIFGEYMGGDIKYRDINDDGVIDENDKVPIGYPTTPEIIYGFGASMGYKALDLSFFFQGSARSSFFIDPRRTAPFINMGEWDGKIGNNALLKAYADDHWSENNRNLYATWPRLSAQVVENNIQTSTWFLRNGAFLRLKSLELGYTLPKNSFTDRMHIASLRLYLSGTNLLNISAFKLWDVEMGGNGLGYPIQKVINLGLNVNF
jgi:TonB-linked SusC/RagA family outer membrane protein